MSFLAAGAVGKAKLAAAAGEASAGKSLLGPGRSSRGTLSMYDSVPDGEIALEEFERFAMDRLRGELGRRHSCGSCRQLADPCADAQYVHIIPTLSVQCSKP